MNLILIISSMLQIVCLTLIVIASDKRAKTNRMIGRLETKIEILKRIDLYRKTRKTKPTKKEKELVMFILPELEP